MTSNNCSEVCERVSFNRDRSTSYDIGRQGHLYNSINFGDVVMLRGGNSTDQVVAGSNKSDIVRGYTFFEITDAKMRDINNVNGSTYKFPYDGVLGLSLDPNMTSTVAPEDGVPLAVAMKVNGLIENAIIALNFKEGDGTLSFGGYNESDLRV